MAAGTHLASLPVQRPQAVKGTPVLILGTRSIRIVADLQLLTRNWWAIVLPGM